MPKRPIVIFDFGNVIIDLDYTLAFNNIKEVLKVNWPDKKLPQDVVNWIIEFESGNLTEETFIWKFQSNYNKNLLPNDFIKAWNSMLLSIPTNRIKFLDKIALDYDTYLLSNTNSFHLAWIRNYLKNEHSITDFDSRFFKKTFYSHLVGDVKPNLSIYAHVTQKIACRPSDIIFIDDMSKNIKAAIDFGWYAVKHDPIVGIEQSFLNYIDMYNRLFLAD